MRFPNACFVFAILLGVTVAQAQKPTGFLLVTGSGTSKTIPIWTGNTVIGNSPIFVSNGQIQIATTLNAFNSSSTVSAIIGNNSASSGNVNGVFGISASPSGNGVLGINAAATGYAVGVTGITSSTAGAGLNGFSNTATGGIGVTGAAATSGTGVFGLNQFCNGSICTPVAGTAGLFLTGTGGTVLTGFNGTTNANVFNVDSSGNGFYAGNLTVTGNLTKGSGAFKIDHPLDPANKYLSHSFVESPDMLNMYNGIVVLDSKGKACVKLPEYFQALNSDFRYQLTAIGAPGPNLYIAEEISGNHFKIAGGKPGAKVSWQVTGVRQDAYAQAHRIEVEEDKPAQERGHYLHPELFGATDQRAIGAIHTPAPALPIQPPAGTEASLR